MIEGNGHKILVDTGMPSTEIVHKYHHPDSFQPEGHASFEQLEKLGILTAEIYAVILIRTSPGTMLSSGKVRRAGAMSLHQGREVVSKGVGIEEYVKDHAELAAAVNQFTAGFGSDDPVSVNKPPRVFRGHVFHRRPSA